VTGLSDRSLLAKMLSLMFLGGRCKVLKWGVDAAVLEGGRGDDNFEVDGSDLGQSEEETMLTDGTKDPVSDTGTNNGSVDNMGNRCFDEQIAYVFQEMKTDTRLNRLLTSVDLPMLDGNKNLRNSKFRACKEEFLRVTGLSDQIYRTAHQLKVSDKNKLRNPEAKKILNKKHGDLARKPCSKCGQTVLDEFAQNVTLTSKRDGSTFQYVFCKNTCNRRGCFGICKTVGCTNTAIRKGLYPAHKDSDDRVQLYMTKCTRRC